MSWARCFFLSCSHSPSITIGFFQFTDDCFPFFRNVLLGIRMQGWYSAWGFFHNNLAHCRNWKGREITLGTYMPISSPSCPCFRAGVKWISAFSCTLQGASLLCPCCLMVSWHSWIGLSLQAVFVIWSLFHCPQMKLLVMSYYTTFSTGCPKSQLMRSFGQDSRMQHA